jgi:type IV pilus assembly protein PilC
MAYTLQEGVVKGRIEAQSEAGALASLRHQGYRPLRVVPSGGRRSLEELFPSFFQVGTGELVAFCRHLASLLSSGGNLLRGLGMLEAEVRSRQMRRTLQRIREVLDAGGSFSSALAQCPLVFNPFFVSVVQVGEYTGRLGPALEQMADILEKEREAKQKLLRAMLYPMAIMGLSLITLAVLMTVALPPLLEVFKQMGSDLPLMTRLALALFGGLKANIFAVLGSVLGTGVLLLALQQVPAVRFRLDKAKVRAPLWGSITLAGALARFSRSMALLLEAGVPLSTALRLSQSGCKNMALRRAFGEAEEGLLSGQKLTDALKRHTVIPPLFIELVSIGEETNSLGRTMADAAVTYQKRLEQRLDSLLGVMEPALTIGVGAIVGFIALSMFTPIYSGMQSLGK